MSRFFSNYKLTDSLYSLSVGTFKLFSGNFSSESTTPETLTVSSVVHTLRSLSVTEPQLSPFERLSPELNPFWFWNTFSWNCPDRVFVWKQKLARLELESCVGLVRVSFFLSVTRLGFFNNVYTRYHRHLARRCFSDSPPVETKGEQSGSKSRHWAKTFWPTQLPGMQTH